MEAAMTMAEIEVRFPGEWVLIADPEVDDSLNVLGGTVLYHNPDRDEFDRESLRFAGRRFAVRYVGEPMAEMEFVL